MLSGRHELAERREPFRKTFLLEMIGPTIAFVRGAVECCPPFDEGLIARDDRGNANRRDIVAHGKRWRIAKRVGVGALAVGMSKQDLADDLVPGRDPADGSDLIARLP